MNDAGWAHPGAVPVAGEGLLSWFQVEAGAVSGHRPLPVQPFLRCVENVTLKCGAVRLSVVHGLTPGSGARRRDATRPRRAGFASMQTKEWFTGGGHRPGVIVVLDVGQGPALVAAKFAKFIERLDQNVFTVQRSEAAGPEQICWPLFDDSFWNGPPGNGVVLHGELAEWSCDAIGWFGEIVADAAVRFGVASPLFYTVRRTTQDT